MSYAQRLLLQAPPWDAPALEAFVEKCLRDGVQLVCVVGPDADRVSDVIDELVVGDGARPGRFITTTAHEGESFEMIRAFAKAWTLNGDPVEPAQEVTLTD